MSDSLPTPPIAPRKASRSFAPEILLRAQDIELVIFDVDGVLTDGGIYFAETDASDLRIADETIKRFNTLDGFGLQLLKRAGITPAVISGRNSKPLQQRLANLGITHCYLGQENKLDAAVELMQQLGHEWEQVAVMGDDWPDLPLLCRSALAVAPPNAHIEVLNVVHYCTNVTAGNGAVRELCDLLVASRGHYQTLLNQMIAGQ